MQIKQSRPAALGVPNALSKITWSQSVLNYTEVQVRSESFQFVICVNSHCSSDVALCFLITYSAFFGINMKNLSRRP